MKLEAALKLAAHHKVFPLNPNSKTPRFRDWQTWASMDTAKIRAHWTRYPDDNIGLLMGRYPDGYRFAVDVDVKAGKCGDTILRKLEATHGALPRTYTQRTPSGGTHYVLTSPQPIRQGSNVLGNGIDTRSVGGFIVGAGSTIDGKAYQCI